MKYISVQDFNTLKKNDKIDHVNTILDRHKVYTGNKHLKLETHDSLNKFYDLLYDYLLKGEDLTKEIVFKFAEQVTGINLEKKETKKVPTLKEDTIPFEELVLKYKNVGKGKYILKRSTEGSSGYDLYVDRCITDEEIGINSNMIQLLPFESKKYATGIAIELPKGYHAEVVLRSGLFKPDNKLILTNSIGLIDNDYRGEIILQLTNVSNKHAFGPVYGKRVAQLIIRKSEIFITEEVLELSETNRGTGGFGSTGE